LGLDFFDGLLFFGVWVATEDVGEPLFLAHLQAFYIVREQTIS